MIDLQTLLDAIDQLEPEELEQIQARIEQQRQTLYQKRIDTEDPKMWIAGLHAALAEFREGITDEEWQEISTAMNAEYVEPEDPELFDWLDDLPQDERFICSIRIQCRNGCRHNRVQFRTKLTQ
jgi:hypothetical protein